MVRKLALSGQFHTNIFVIHPIQNKLYLLLSIYTRFEGWKDVKKGYQQMQLVIKADFQDFLLQSTLVSFQAPSPVYSLFAQVLGLLASRRHSRYFRSKIRAQAMVPDLGSDAVHQAMGSLLIKENPMGPMQPRLS